MTLTQAEKDRIVGEVRARMRTWYSGPNLEAACLYWAGMVCHVLHARGVRAILQAGTHMWPCMGEDDGVSATHFSYVWEPDHPLSVNALAAGGMPEMHVWVGVPATGEIIDVTTCYLVKQARVRAGINWTAPAPPDYLWSSKPPTGVVYRPNREATMLAMRFLAEAA